ncbi:hypothetical protein J6590_067474 [Homalodisca vitripennis]|nr:hypothetical protein J6590_067472 [Homalodisca vitripennis]KAG8325451.1 hypothetical protein J6590_067474 [Homalodisca vitripennis]
MGTSDAAKLDGSMERCSLDSVPITYSLSERCSMGQGGRGLAGAGNSGDIIIFGLEFNHTALASYVTLSVCYSNNGSLGRGDMLNP